MAEAALELLLFLAPEMTAPDLFSNGLFRTMSEELDDDSAAEHALCDMTAEVAKNTILNVTMNLNPHFPGNMPLKAEEKAGGTQVD